MLREVATTLLDMLAPFSCIECASRAATPAAPLCGPCGRRLAWWRTIDGCPRCGLAPLSERSAPSAGSAFSDSTRGLFQQLTTASCAGCYSDGSALESCHALLRYEGRARDWIPRFKHRSTPFGPLLRDRLAIEFLAGELARRLDAQRVERPDLVVPIPLHPRRRRQRGFNQSDTIARRIANALRLPFSNDALLRHRDTPPQAKLSHRQRRANLRAGFRARRTMRGLERVWLVDDVLTTGATLDAAAEACLAAGAGEVHALALAATPPRRQRS